MTSLPAMRLLIGKKNIWERSQRAYVNCRDSHGRTEIQPSATDVDDNINTSYHGNIFAKSLFAGAAIPAKY